jgi:hypothetical protein
MKTKVIRCTGTNLAELQKVTFFLAKAEAAKLLITVPVWVIFEFFGQCTLPAKCTEKQVEGGLNEYIFNI